jgi:peptide chain release factor subunit 1
MEKAERELAKLISHLKGLHGSGTELISVYIPSGYSISDVSNKLRNEHGQAANIKSKTTRLNVQSALEKIIQYLKMFRETPPNGLAIFCGNISKIPGKIDIELFSISPPEPINVQIYRCDSSFLLEPLELLGGRKERYGLVAIDGTEATIAVLQGNVHKIVRYIPYLGPSKTHKGGSASLRYDRTMQEAKEAYYRKIGEEMDKTLFSSGITKVIVGGPGPVKEIFLKMKPFNYQFKILGVVDIGYSDEYGILELKEKSIDIIAEEKSIEEREIMNRFMKEVVKGGLATYGVKEVMDAIQIGKAEVVLLSEKLELKHAKMRCSQGHEYEIFREEGKEYRCPQDGNILSVVEEKDLFDELYDMADEKGIDVKVISADTRDGAQFLAGFKGIGALLRYQ